MKLLIGLKADYERECTEKLTSIRDTRARQANIIQGELVQQAGAAGGAHNAGQNHMRPPYPSQLQAPMQASPIPMQQHAAMRMNTPNQQASMQQQQALLQNQSRPAVGGQREDFNVLSASENEQIRVIADKMAMNTSPGDLEKIKMNLQNMSQDQRQSLARRGIEPLTYFFRTQAMKEFKRQKRAKMEMAARAHNSGPDSNNAVMGDPMGNAQQRQMGQHMMAHQGSAAFTGNGQQAFDPNFMGSLSVDQIQGQQADGLRSQEAGQLVVPANPPQAANQQSFGAPQANVSQQPGQTNEPSGNRVGSNPKAVPQQQLSNAPSTQHDKLQHAAQLQPQTQAQARAQVAANAQMAMSSQAGQANPQLPQQQPQRSPAMPMLNRQMDNQAPQQQLNAQGRPPSTAPPMGHQHPGQQGIPGQTAVPNSRPQIPPNLPANLRDQLAQMPPEHATALLASLQRHNFTNNQSMARTPSQASLGVQQTPPQPGQPSQRNGQVGGEQNLRTPVPMQQQLSDVGGLPPQAQPFQNSPMSMQQRHPQQRPQQNQPQNDALRLQYLRQQNGGMEMTEEQIQEMDRVPFPHAMLNANANMTPPPQNVKTWGQLKQWTSQNPHVFGGVDLPKLLSLQRIHFASVSAQKREAARNANQTVQNQAEPFASMQGQQTRPPFQQQNFQPGQNPAQRQPMNMPPMRPVTANEVQMARQRLGPQAQNFTDEHIKLLVQKNRQKQYWEARNAASAQQGLTAKTANQGQPPQATPQQTTNTPAQQNASQGNRQVQPPKAGVKPQAAATNKNSRPTNAKQPQKNSLKRPNSDDVVEVQNPDRQQNQQPTTEATNSQPTQPTATAQAPTKPGIQQYTREQLAAMTPQQRAQIEAHSRRQQAQPKQQITKANADEAWSRLPEHIKQMYAEMVQNATKIEPVSMTPEQRNSMAQQLRVSTEMLSRVDALVRYWAGFPGFERLIQALLNMVSRFFINLVAVM